MMDHPGYGPYRQNKDAASDMLSEMTNTGDSNGAIIEKINGAIGELTPRQFDQLVVYLLKELDPTSSIEFVRTDADTAVDIEVHLDHPFLKVAYGVQLEQLGPSESVDADTILKFNTSLSDRQLHTGVVITSGTIGDSAAEAAEAENISTLTGDEIARLLVEHELGFMRTESSITLDQAFWDLFRGPERTQTIPSIEVPQADSIDRLEQSLRAVDAGNHHKADIAHAVEAISGDSFDPRQADYYGTAGWLLGFLHKDLEARESQGRGRWGMTRRGKTYLSNRLDGEDDAANAILYAQIRQMEIARRVLQQLREHDSLRRESVSSIVKVETALSGTTVSRRTLTVVRWLERLPEIEVQGRGPSQEIRHLDPAEGTIGDTSDFESSQPSISTPENDTHEDDKAVHPPDEGSVLDEILTTLETLK